MAVFNWAIVGRSASDMMAYKLLGLTLILPAVGTVLGVASMFQRRRYRGLPIAGLAINVLLGLFLLLIIVPSLGHELRYW
jgi:heme/copper-type cytochrome/quinol oxidase subunit 3